MSPLDDYEVALYHARLGALVDEQDAPEDEGEFISAEQEARIDAGDGLDA